MKRALNWVAPIIVGFVVGALVSMGAPAGAKGGMGPRALARQMAALEMRVTQMELDEAASTEATEARLQELEQLTQLLDHDGSYVGYVDSVQVWSHYCEDGADAKWIDFDGYTELSCDSPALAPRRTSDVQSLKKSAGE